MQFTTQLGVLLPLVAAGRIGNSGKERRADKRERRKERRELKADRKNRKLSATTKAERRDMKQVRKNDRVANRHEFRMSDNFKAAAQARSQIATNAIQAGSKPLAPKRAHFQSDNHHRRPHSFAGKQAGFKLIFRISDLEQGTAVSLQMPLKYTT